NSSQRSQLQTSNFNLRTSNLTKAFAEHPHQPLPALAAARRGAAHRLEHLAHLDELLQHAVDLFDPGAAPARDALAAAAVDDAVVAPLAGRHRVDDRLDVRELFVVDLRPLL